MYQGCSAQGSGSLYTELRPSDLEPDDRLYGGDKPVLCAPWAKQQVDDRVEFPLVLDMAKFLARDDEVLAKQPMPGNSSCKERKPYFDTLFGLKESVVKKSC